MTLLLVYISIALGASFLCSIMEAVLLSVTPSYIARLDREQPALGEKLQDFKRDVDRPLAAILSLNTIAHTVGAAGAGAQAANLYGDAYVGVISGVLTLLILVISEIIPKTLGAVYWRRLTPWVVRLLVPTIYLMWPLVILSKGLTRLIARGRKTVLISREEFSALAEVGSREGVFHEHESRILENLFRLGSLTARDIMTPRTVIFALPSQQTVEETLAQYPNMRFSRIPIFGRNRDDIIGFVLKSEILQAAVRNEGSRPLSELERELRLVSENLGLRDLFELLMNSGQHLALVVDNYGGTSGLVTLEDLVETLLGVEIVDEADSVEDMRALARKKWAERARKLGMLDVEEKRADTPDAAPTGPADGSQKT